MNGRSFFCSISSGRRQSRAETCPACTQAKRVSMDPARLEMAAALRSLRERRDPANAAAMRSASGTGPLSTPPSRVMNPLVPRFSGSTAGFCESLDVHAFQRFDGRSADAQRVQRRVVVAHQLENADRRVQARHSEVNRQAADVFVPDRNGGRANQHSGVVGERQSRGGRECLGDVAQACAPASRSARRRSAQTLPRRRSCRMPPASTRPPTWDSAA